MEGKEKTYIVYRATAPNGKCYVGYTSMALAERWRHHKRRAENGEAPEYPFYCAIRNYGAENFQVEEVCRTYNRPEAMRLEEKHIAETPEDRSMNLSSGGINDAAEGGRIFWERMNANPVEKAAFLKKLSDRKRKQDWTDYEKLRLGNERWRREHPREAYALAYRALRIANCVTGRPAPCESPIDPRPLKECLMHKYRQRDIRSAAVAQVWEDRSDSEKADIGSKISSAQKKHFSVLSEAEKRQVTEKARAAIDRKKQGAAASRGIKAWWAELKKNPEAHTWMPAQKHCLTIGGNEMRTYDIINAGPNNRFMANGRIVSNSGKLVQLQNLPRNEMSDLEHARYFVKSGDFETLQMLYDDIPDTLSQLIRTAFVPQDGRKFVVADFSAIEARVIAWLAGEDWRLEVFANGGDIYCASASQMFGVPVVKHGINGHLRQKGKIAELALGYGGSVGALKSMGALDMGLQEDELQPLVDAWREANPNITALWWAVDRAVKECIKRRLPTETHGIRFEYKSGFLFIVLPSGRRLAYAKPHMGENRFGSESVIYMGIGNTKKRERLESYGPKFVENIVQAISRDILCYAMRTLSTCAIVAHVHDELIIEADRRMSLKAVCEQMGRTPPWAGGAAPQSGRIRV